MHVYICVHVYVMIWNRFSFITKDLWNQIVLSQQSHVKESSFVPLVISKTHNHLFQGEKEREEGKGEIWKGRICSCSFPEAELFITLSLFDKSEFYNKIFPNRALSVEVSYRWEENDTDPIRKQSRCHHVPNHSSQLPYLPSPQTPSRAFFIRTSKPSKVIKIAPA